MALRGIENRESAEKYLAPSLDQLYDPYLLRDMDAAVRRIRKTAEKAVADGLANPDKFKIDLPNKFDVEVEFKEHSKARRGSFYPGVRQIGPRTIAFSSDAYYDVLRFFMFCL